MGLFGFFFFRSSRHARVLAASIPGCTQGDGMSAGGRQPRSAQPKPTAERQPSSSSTNPDPHDAPRDGSTQGTVGGPKPPPCWHVPGWPHAALGIGAGQGCHIPAPTGLTTGTALCPCKDTWDHLIEMPPNTLQPQQPQSPSGAQQLSLPKSQEGTKKKKKTNLATNIAFIKDLDLMAWRNTWSHRAELYGAAVPRVWAAHSPPLSAGASGARFGDGLQTPILFVGLCSLLLWPKALSLGATGCPDFILFLSQVAFHSSPTLL